MRNKFIFDLDDTLIYSHHYYSIAKLDFAKFVLDSLGPRVPDAKAIIELAEKKDNTLIGTLGFSPKRFPTSFVQAFEEIAKTMHVSPGDLEFGKSKSYEIGSRVFNMLYRSKSLVDNASKTLDFLLDNRDELFLLTMGDKAVQEDKVENCGIKKWFGENIYVVPQDKGPMMQKLSSEADKSRVWYVGNSMKSDILPAINSGIGAVYVPFEAWQFLAHTGEIPVNDRLIKVDSIDEIISLYPSKFS